MAFTLQDVGQIALQLGYNQDAARVAMAIAQTEGALNGAVGDNGQSFGPYQFYAGGQLPNFAVYLGTDPATAGQYARQHPDVAVRWALSGYLGSAIRQGQAKGLSGSSLATYAQTYGQVSQSPERAGTNYAAMFGGGGSASGSAGGGGETMASGLTQEDFNRIVAQHGGLVGSSNSNPYIKDENDLSTPNPTPTYKYVFKDGTSMTMITSPDGSFQVVDPGSALKQAAGADSGKYSGISAPSSQRQILITGADGSTQWLDNPNYDPVKALADQADAQWSATYQKLQADYLAGKASREETQMRLDEAHKQISEDLARSAQAISMRGQDLDYGAQTRGQDISAATARRGQDLDYSATLRGQDIGAETTRRGQTLGFGQGMANTAIGAMMDSLPYLQVQGTQGDFIKAVNGIATGTPGQFEVRSAAFPFNPGELAFQYAQRAMDMVSARSPAAAASFGQPAPQPSFQAPGMAAPAPAPAPAPAAAPVPFVPPTTGVGGGTRNLLARE